MGTMAVAKQKAAKHKLQRDALPGLAWAWCPQSVLRILRALSKEGDITQNSSNNNNKENNKKKKNKQEKKKQQQQKNFTQ